MWELFETQCSTSAVRASDRLTVCGVTRSILLRCPQRYDFKAAVIIGKTQHQQPSGS